MWKFCVEITCAEITYMEMFYIIIIVCYMSKFFTTSEKFEKLLRMSGEPQGMSSAVFPERDSSRTEFLCKTRRDFSVDVSGICRTRREKSIDRCCVVLRCGIMFKVIFQSCRLSKSCVIYFSALLAGSLLMDHPRLH